MKAKVLTVFDHFRGVFNGNAVEALVLYEVPIGRLPHQGSRLTQKLDQAIGF